MRKAKTVLITCLIVFLITHIPILRSDENLHRVWAVKDCRIVTQAGPPIAKGTVVIRDGLIEAVGAKVTVPADAEVIDGSMLTVYPGLIDPLGKSLIKLPEQKFDQTKMLTGQYTDEDRGINPGFTAFDHFEITKSTLEKYHKAGFTTAQVLPVSRPGPRPYWTARQPKTAWPCIYIGRAHTIFWLPRRSGVLRACGSEVVGPRAS